MIKAIKSKIKYLLEQYPQRICRQEYEGQYFTRSNERPVEFAFVFCKLNQIYPRKILDVGSGTTALPHIIRNCGFLVTATDNVRGYWPKGMLNRHYHIIDDDITNTRLNDKFDFITCISVLEHIEDFNVAVKNMFSLLNPNGHLLLTFPYNEKEYIRNVYELDGSSYGKGNPYITQAFSRDQIDKWIQDYPESIIDQEYWQFWEGDHWTVGKQIIPPKKVRAEDKHQLTCLLIKKIS